ncbi:MAG: glycosyltransferase family 2 protein [bacterium]
MELVFIVINYENTLLTEECLISLSRYADGEKKIVLLDNGSRDRSIEKLACEFREVDFIFHSTNSGFCKGNNIAIKHSISKYNPRYIFLVNNDAAVKSGDLRALLNFMDKNKKIGILGPKIISYSTGKIWSAGGQVAIWRGFCRNRGINEEDRGQYENEASVDFVSGCAMLIRTELLEIIGYFDEKYFMYLEDVDICLRAKRNNYLIQYYPDFIIDHKISQSAGSEYSYFSSFFRWRNRLLLVNKNAKKLNFYFFKFVIFPLIACRDMFRYIVYFQIKGISSMIKGLLHGNKEVV